MAINYWPLYLRLRMTQKEETFEATTRVEIKLEVAFELLNGLDRKKTFQTEEEDEKVSNNQS